MGIVTQDAARFVYPGKVPKELLWPMLALSSISHLTLCLLYLPSGQWPITHDEKRRSSFIVLSVNPSVATDGVLAPHHLEWNLGSVYPLFDRMKLLP